MAFLWLKILASITRQKKHIEAGPVAAWLWIGGIGYCRETSTDGFIPAVVVPSLCPGLKNPIGHAKKLVSVGLWDEVEGGYKVHDYLDWNPSREELIEERKDAVERQKRSRSSRSSQPSVTSDKPVTHTLVTDLGSSAGTRAGATDSTDSTSLSTSVVSEKHARPLISGSAQRLHGQHAFCGRVCVPYDLHDELAGRLGGSGASIRLIAWYPTVLYRYEGRSIGDDLFAFWRNEFGQWAGTVSTKPVAGKGTRAVNAFDDAHDAIVANEARK